MKSSKLLWVVIVCLVVTAVGGVTVYWWSKRVPRDERLLQKGVMLMRTGKTALAISALYESVRVNPKNLDAHRFLVEVLAQNKDFESAARAIEAAEKEGMASEDAMFMRAALFLARAGYRRESAGDACTEKLCDEILAQEVSPAIKLLRGLAAGEAKTPAYLKRLGDAYRFKASMLNLKRGRVDEKRRVDVKLRKEASARKRKVEVLEIIAEIRRTIASSRQAYAQAIELDPKAVAPRLALAEQYLRLYVPGTQPARELLQPILEDDPSDSATLLLMGEIERLEGHVEKALATFGRVRGHDAVGAAARLREAELLLDAGRFREADPLTKDLLKKSPNRWRSAYLRGRVLTELGELDEAILLMQNIFVNERVHLPEVRSALAKLLLRMGKRQQGLQAYRDTIADVELTPPTTAAERKKLMGIKYEACMALAREQKDESGSEARRYARKALMLFPTRSEAYELARHLYNTEGLKEELDWVFGFHAMSLFRVGRYDEVMSLSRKDRGMLQDKGHADLLIARCLVQKGAFTEAIAAYEALLKQGSKDLTAVRLEMAGQYLRLGRKQDAEKMYRKILEEEPNDVPTTSRLAKLLVSMDRSKEAGELLLKAEAGGRRAPVLGGPLVWLYLQEKDYDAAIGVVKGQIKDRPGEPQLYVAVGNLLWTKGDRAGAREYYDKALADKRPPATAYRRVLLDLVEEKYDAAITLAGKGIKQYPAARMLNVMIAVAHLGKGDDVRAREVFAAALKDVQLDAKSKGRVVRMLDVMRAVAGESAPGEGEDTDEKAPVPGAAMQTMPSVRSDKARFLEAVRALRPKARRKAAIVFSVMTLAMQYKVLGEAVRQAEALEKLMPDDPLAPCQKAQILDRIGEHAQAVEEYDRVIGREPDYLTALFLKAGSHMAWREHHDAIAALEKALEKELSRLQRVQILLNLAGQYQLLGHVDPAIRHLESVIEYPEIAAWGYNDLAWLLATEKGELSRALGYAEKAVAAQPKVATLRDTLGWIHYLRRDYGKAIAELELAARSLPGQPAVRYHLGAAYAAAGKKAEGLRELNEALAIGRAFPEAKAARELAERLAAGK